MVDNKKWDKKVEAFSWLCKRKYLIVINYEGTNEDIIIAVEIKEKE